jgi:phage I-like protein
MQIGDFGDDYVEGNEHVKEEVILPDGKVPVAGKPGEHFVLNLASAKKILAAFDKQGNHIPVDWEHSSLERAERGLEAPAAGWIIGLRYVKDKGLIARIKWNERAAEQINAGEYKYLSPAGLVLKKTSEFVELHSVALTNRPAIKDLPALKAASERLMKEMAMPEPNGTEGEMGTGATPDQLVGELKSLLEGKGVEIPEGAGIPEILQAAIGYLKGGTEAEGEGEAEGEPAAASIKVLEKLGLEKGADEETVLKALVERSTRSDTDMIALSEYKAVKTVTETLQRRLDERDAADAKAKVDVLVQKAYSEGKLIETDEENVKWFRAAAEKDFDQATRFLAQMAVKIQQGSVMTAGTSDNRQKVIAMSVQEWEQNPGAQAAIKKNYVNGSLRNKELGALTNKEIEAL